MAHLGDGLVLDIQPGFACGDHNKNGEGITHLRPMNVNQEGEMDFSTMKYIPANLGDRDERLINQGDVIFNNTNSPELVGKTAYYSHSEPSAFSNHMTRIRCNLEVIMPQYCALSLHQKWREGYFQSVCNNHVSQASVGRAVLMETLIAIPPLQEQKRIVARVAEVTSNIDRARERLAKVPGILKRFRQSVLAAACSGRLTADWRERQEDLEPLLLEKILKERRLEWEKNQIAEFRARGINSKDQNWKARYKEPLSSNSEDLPELPETWCWATIEQLAAPERNAITDGPFGSNLKTSHYTNSGPRVIRLQNIGEGVFINESAHVSDEHYETLAKHRVYAGDLVIAALGAKLPRACVIPSFIGPAIVKADCIRFKPDPILTNAHYLNYALNEESGRHRTASVVHGVARPRLNLGEIRAIAIPLPPLAEQQEIVRRVEALFQLADTIEARVAAATTRADRLTQAVLAKAFRGELVLTEAELSRREGRDYEPAAALLERIKEERRATAHSQPPRKTKRKSGISGR